MDVLRSTLQPITHNLPTPVSGFLTSLIGPDCYRIIFLDIDPSSSVCLKLLISKALGIVIIAASSIVKVPQILKLISSGSAQGVSFLSYALETAGYTISLAYNVRQGFPFSTYGETAFVMVQNVIIAILVLRLSGKSAEAAGFVASLAVLGAALFREEIVGGSLLSVLQVAAGLLGVASKAPQIWTVWREGGTGQLSAFAVCLFSPAELHHLAIPPKGYLTNIDRDFRSSTTSSDPLHASSLLSKKSMTNSSSIAILLPLRSMRPSPRRWPITGTAVLRLR